MATYNDLDLVAPVPVDSHNLTVQFNGSKSEANVLWNDHCEMIAYSAGCMSDDKPGKLGVSVAEIREYLDALLYLRVKYVRRELPADLRDWYEHAWVVPALTSVIFKQIGKASDVETGVHILPDTVLPQPDPVKMQKVSRALRAAKQRFHLMVGEELPRAREGSFEFMATVVMNDQVLAHSTETHPTRAFFASVAANTMLNDIFSPRISYGDTGFFRKFVNENVIDGIIKRDAYTGSSRARSDSRDDKQRFPKHKGGKKPSEPSSQVDGDS